MSAPQKCYFNEIINGQLVVTAHTLRESKSGANAGCLYISDRTGVSFGRWATQDDINKQPDSFHLAYPHYTLHPNPPSRKFEMPISTSSENEEKPTFYSKRAASPAVDTVDLIRHLISKVESLQTAIEEVRDSQNDLVENLTSRDLYVPSESEESDSEEDVGEDSQWKEPTGIWIETDSEEEEELVKKQITSSPRRKRDRESTPTLITTCELHLLENGDDVPLNQEAFVIYEDTKNNNNKKKNKK